MIDQEIPGYHNFPEVHPLPRNLFCIKEPLVYHWMLNSVPQRITLPASEKYPYVFDGASIPVLATFLTWALPFLETIYPMGLHIYAAAFHDWFWSYQGRIPIGAHEVYKSGQWVDAGKIWTFTETNRLFGRMLKEDGVGGAERDVMQMTVQSPIGWLNWKRGKVPDDARALPKKT